MIACMLERRKARGGEEEGERERRARINDGSLPAQATDDSASGHSDPSRECHFTRPRLTRLVCFVLETSCIH